MSINITVISKYLNITKLCFSNTHVIRGLGSLMVGDIKTFIAVSIPTMLFFRIRHALDVDHITA